MDSNNIFEGIYERYHGTIREDFQRIESELDPIKQIAFTFDDSRRNLMEYSRGDGNPDLVTKLETVTKEFTDIKKALNNNGGLLDTIQTSLYMAGVDDDDSVKKSTLPVYQNRAIVKSQEIQVRVHALNKLVQEVILELELAADNYDLDVINDPDFYAERGMVSGDGAAITLADRIANLHDYLKLFELHIEAQRDVLKQSLPTPQEMSADRNDRFEFNKNQREAMLEAERQQVRDRDQTDLGF